MAGKTMTKRQAYLSYRSLLGGIFLANRELNERDMSKVIDSVRPKETNHGALKYIEAWEQARKEIMLEHKKYRDWLDTESLKRSWA